MGMILASDLNGSYVKICKSLILQHKSHSLQNINKRIKYERVESTNMPQSQCHLLPRDTFFQLSSNFLYFIHILKKQFMETQLCSIRLKDANLFPCIKCHTVAEEPQVQQQRTENIYTPSKKPVRLLCTPTSITHLDLNCYVFVLELWRNRIEV